jgi:hypothetical protein
MLRSVKLADFDHASADVLVLGIFQDDEGGLDAALAPLKKAPYVSAIRAAAARTEGSGEAGKLAEAFPEGEGAPKRVMLVGLGKRDKFKPDAVRSAAATVARRVAVTRDR